MRRLLRLPWLATQSIVTLTTLSGSASALTILAQCGPSTGQSHFFEGGFVGPGQGGWKKDGYDNGRITAYITDKGEIDILLRDAIDLRSYIQDGIKVTLIELNEQDRSFLIAASGSNFVETYLFKVNQFGVGTVVWTTSKITSSTTRAGIMSAECGPNYAITAKP